MVNGKLLQDITTVGIKSCAGIPTEDIEIRALSMTTITKSVYTVVLCETMPIVFHT